VELNLQVQRENEIPVLQCRGRIVYRDEASALTEHAYDLLSKHQRLLIDLNGVENIDSGGLGALVMLQMWARQGAGDLKFCHASGRVHQLFELTNLRPVFEIHATREQALNAFSQPAIS
jgi:anti-sigma B factor antagonist